MRFFKKKDKVIDLSEHFRKQQEKTEQLKEDLGSGNSDFSSGSTSQESGGFLSFLSGVGKQNQSNLGSVSSETGSYEDEKKRKLAKRISDMTSKIEELNNLVYRLEQRIEVLERKSGVGY